MATPAATEIYPARILLFGDCRGVWSHIRRKRKWQAKMIKKVESQDNIEKPLFPGYYLRDTTVTEFEKAAEASNAIINAIKGKLNGRKKSNKRADGKQPSAFKI